MNQLDYDLDNYYDSLEEKKECAMCGALIEPDDIYCSNTCRSADEL